MLILAFKGNSGIKGELAIAFNSEKKLKLSLSRSKHCRKGNKGQKQRNYTKNEAKKIKHNKEL